jgi:hypothetical protein
MMTILRHLFWNILIDFTVYFDKMSQTVCV